MKQLYTIDESYTGTSTVLLISAKLIDIYSSSSMCSALASSWLFCICYTNSHLFPVVVDYAKTQFCWNIWLIIFFLV